MDAHENNPNIQQESTRQAILIDAPSSEDILKEFNEEYPDYEREWEQYSHMSIDELKELFKTKVDRYSSRSTYMDDVTVISKALQYKTAQMYESDLYSETTEKRQALDELEAILQRARADITTEAQFREDMEQMISNDRIISKLLRHHKVAATEAELELERTGALLDRQQDLFRNANVLGAGSVMIPYSQLDAEQRDVVTKLHSVMHEDLHTETEEQTYATLSIKALEQMRKSPVQSVFGAIKQAIKDTREYNRKIDNEILSLDAEYQSNFAKMVNALKDGLATAGKFSVKAFTTPFKALAGICTSIGNEIASAVTKAHKNRKSMKDTIHDLGVYCAYGLDRTLDFITNGGESRNYMRLVRHQGEAESILEQYKALGCPEMTPNEFVKTFKDKAEPSHDIPLFSRKLHEETVRQPAVDIMKNYNRDEKYSSEAITHLIERYIDEKKKQLAIIDSHYVLSNGDALWGINDVADKLMNTHIKDLTLHERIVAGYDKAVNNIQTKAADLGQKLKTNAEKAYNGIHDDLITRRIRAVEKLQKALISESQQTALDELQANTNAKTYADVASTLIAAFGEQCSEARKYQSKADYEQQTADTCNTKAVKIQKKFLAQETEISELTQKLSSNKGVAR